MCIGFRCRVLSLRLTGQKFTVDKVSYSAAISMAKFHRRFVLFW